MNQEIQQFVTYIKSRRLEVPVLFFLELYRPLVLLGDSLFTIFNPFLKALFIPDRFLNLFRDRAVLENLILELEKEH